MSHCNYLLFYFPVQALFDSKRIKNNTKFQLFPIPKINQKSKRWKKTKARSGMQCIPFAFTTF